jgi:hypothetical protein
MRRPVSALFAAASLITALSPAWGQSNEPPQAWLFGAWTGGTFPPPSQITAATCLAQPTVIFTRDVVLRSTLTEATYEQRLVATVRATENGFEFRFEPGAGAPSEAGGGLLGLSGGAPPGGAAVGGFGCESMDLLHVERHGENEITFPGCEDFPNPLVRCPAS